ncbi:NIPSNAP family protein [Dothidotthia symphoricarpi CBS 119687]|uniref:NIPSNAP family protein n=1 Tax=Dothidotthia symphoricarpi CBS 119687 TaxID=1392245 RepID=A0A6A6AN87_9PLEO|nr:NIPSNAP family protein [Dothidotthia symphoricarpi CBS 119687]KAF2131951.1 NIPSNAP family protein [Dothidotthia symphoricarpi CBS 119687]
MFTRQTYAGVRSALAVPHATSAARSRAFAAGAAMQSSPRAPTLADITPDSAASFHKKQQAFRDSLVAAQKQKEQQEKEARAREQENTKKKGGALSSLIYGTPEGRELDMDIERSFSQVLARGKYVHSIVFHEVKPDKVDEYVELVGNWYPKMAAIPENKVHLVGSWRTEVGDCNTFVHIWEYQRYEGYHQSLHNIQSHADFPAFNAKLKDLIESKKTSLMQEFSFWPTTAPRQLGGLFELRSYTLHPGNLLEWETHWRRGLKARREVMEGVGAWFVQIGDLNTVHHLWQFANLEERKIRREQSWSVEGWGETVHKTVPLIQTMKSNIMIPCSWSPVS